MLKKIYIYIIILIFILCNFQTVYANSLQVSAKSAILICADNLTVLFSKDENKMLSMASTTKIMTALLTLESAKAENKAVSITKEMITVEGSSMGLREGDILTLEDLAKGMLMASGNDAANSAAIAISGSIDKFVQLMNEKASQIGLKNTHFVTPSGLDDDKHYSTAYDMAILGSYAMENESFYQIASQKSATVDFINPLQRRSYANHNRLITMYKGCIGIKTGYTKKSGRCLVSCAEKDGIRLVAVTLNAPDDWNDHINMFDYGFTNLSNVVFDDTNTEYKQPVVGSDIENLIVKAENAVSLTVPNSDIQRIEKIIKLPHFSYAPISIKETVGFIEYVLDGKTLAKVELKAQDTVKLNKNKDIFQILLEQITSIF